MFDRKSDYAMNKKDPNAIVCKSVTDVHIRLTRADFSSDEEFRKWKAWSDQDYRDTETTGRGFYDNSLPLDDRLVAAGLSMEDLLLGTISQAEQDAARVALVQTIRRSLTDKQFRRLSLYYLHGMTEAEIGKMEGVGQRRIATSLAAGRKALEKIFQIFSDNRG